PSAHSFDGYTRQWNVRNNAHYIQSIRQGNVPSEREELSTRDRVNEYIMTALRTVWGVDLEYVERSFGTSYKAVLRSELQPFVSRGEVRLVDQVATLSRTGKLLADRIAAELFFEA